MLEQLLTNLATIKKNCNENQYDEMVCKAIANYCLGNGLKFSQFQNEFQKQMITEAKKNNPGFTNVRLSVSTGIDRRLISKLLSGENVHSFCAKEDIVMNYVQFYCNQNNTDKIKKRGEFETFQYFCLVAANGTLTHRAIAAELLDQGRIVSDGEYYKIGKCG